MVDKRQEYKDYPCKWCGMYRKFVSTLPFGKWVCTDCYYQVNDLDMIEWQKIVSRLLKKGVKVALGVRLTYEHGKLKDLC